MLEVVILVRNGEEPFSILRTDVLYIVPQVQSDSVVSGIDRRSGLDNKRKVAIDAHGQG